MPNDADPQTRVGDRYVLQEELGRGGMASVHRAHDEVLDRTVAIKLLHPHLAHDPAFLERFRREARAAAALSHPNVVGVHDWGEGEDGAYLVLQLVDGLSLREILRDRGRLDPDEALAVLGPAAAGLAAAHAAGLVHRDVKPENLLIGRDGTVRVTDFGLARAAASATSTFGADVLVGSPHYLSPEAVNGWQLDARADVYALGIVLFECLTGTPPHEGDTPFLTAMQHTSTPVPVPSSRRPELDESIDDVVVLATAIDREERVPDAAAFGRVLAAAIPGGASDVSRATTRDLIDMPNRPFAERTGVIDDGRTRRLELDDTDTDTDSEDRDAGTGFATVVAAGSLTDAGPDAATTVVDRPMDGGDVRGGAAPRASGSARHAAAVEPRRRRGWLVLLLVLLLVGGSAAGGYLVWDRVIAPMTPIPGVLGAAEPVAVERLMEAGFEVAVDDQRPHDRVTPEGHVLEQQPDDAARLGSTVTLTVSAGPVQVEISDLRELPADDALDALRDDGLEGVVVEAHDEDVTRGEVIDTAPPAGVVVDEGSEVTVTVSLGPAPVEVPTLTGSRESEAREALREVGLRLEVGDRRTDPDAPEGAVLAQDPAPGTVLRRGDEVTVVVSEGPEQVEVPVVRGQRVEDAVDELRALGFEVEIERRGGFGAFLNPDRVYDQDPAPESLRDVGSTILLYAYEA
jgi:eukaryotic-like serine/threonine-protein kinase